MGLGLLVSWRVSPRVRPAQPRGGAQRTVPPAGVPA